MQVQNSAAHGTAGSFVESSHDVVVKIEESIPLARVLYISINEATLG